MVEFPRPVTLGPLFHALGDPTRRALVERLSAGEHSVGELAEPFDISLAAVSKHIHVLERAGLVRREVRGRVHVCRLDPAPLRAGIAWLRRIERFWGERLDALEAALHTDSEQEDPS